MGPHKEQLMFRRHDGNVILMEPHKGQLMGLSHSPYLAT